MKLQQSYIWEFSSFLLIFPVSDTSFWPHSWAHCRLCRPDSPALQEWENIPNSVFILFINVKITPPGLQFWKLWSGKPNYFKHLLKCCPEEGNSSTGAFTIWAGSSPKTSKNKSANMRMYIVAENMQEQGRDFSPVLFLQFRLTLSLSKLENVIRRWICLR